MSHSIATGDTFHLKAAVTNPHLYVAAYHDPLKGLLLVNMTSDMKYEATCILNPGEHPFVKVRTLIAYEHARLYTAYDCQQIEAQGITQKHAPLAPEVLRRVQDGVLNSRFTDRRMKALVQEALGQSKPPKS
ncbi:MAG TPA: hypothetical protein VLT84_10195 [Acidobacteriota bacterium]|nr:hypothetical protein [Acidobacteriota bacterium]